MKFKKQMYTNVISICLHISVKINVTSINNPTNLEFSAIMYVFSIFYIVPTVYIRSASATEVYV